MKKLVHLIASLSKGGAEKILVDLAINSTDKYEVTVISQFSDYDNDLDVLLKQNNVNVIYLNKKLGFDVKAIFDLYKTLKNIKPDIIHTHLQAAPYAVLYYLFNKKNAKIHTIHSIPEMEIPKTHRIVQKFAYKYLKVVPVAISHNVGERTAKIYNIDVEKIPVIYNGIDTVKFNGKKKYDCEHNKIINVASFSEWKNQGFLVKSYKRAIKTNKNLALTFVGDGTKREQIENDCKGLENVRFIGLTNDVKKYLDESDVFVLCSTFEGVPLSILEAYASGLPVIASNVGGIPDILKDGENGFLVEVNNVEDLCCSILKLLSDNMLYQKISENNILFSQNFDIRKITKQYINLYEKKLGELI